MVLLSAPLVAGKVLGIDLGSENIKVAIVQPGRVPISIVTNEMSRRKSPGTVCFNGVCTTKTVGIVINLKTRIISGCLPCDVMKVTRSSVFRCLDLCGCYCGQIVQSDQ